MYSRPLSPQGKGYSGLIDNIMLCLWGERWDGTVMLGSIMVWLRGGTITLCQTPNSLVFCVECWDVTPTPQPPGAKPSSSSFDLYPFLGPPLALVLCLLAHNASQCLVLVLRRPAPIHINTNLVKLSYTASSIY